MQQAAGCLAEMLASQMLSWPLHSSTRCLRHTPLEPAADATAVTMLQRVASSMLALPLDRDRVKPLTACRWCWGRGRKTNLSICSPYRQRCCLRRLAGLCGLHCNLCLPARLLLPRKSCTWGKTNLAICSPYRQRCGLRKLAGLCGLHSNLRLPARLLQPRKSCTWGSNAWVWKQKRASLLTTIVL